MFYRPFSPTDCYSHVTVQVQILCSFSKMSSKFIGICVVLFFFCMDCIIKFRIGLMEKQGVCQHDICVIVYLNAQHHLKMWFEFHTSSGAKPREGYCVSLVVGTELKSPLHLIWGRNGQIIFRTIWMRFSSSLGLKTDEWINADTFTSAQEMCLATSLEQVSLVVHHRTLGSPHHGTEGRGGGGQKELRRSWRKS